MFADLLRTRAAGEDEAVALVVDGAGSLTWGEWERRSNAFAHGLMAAGTGNGDRVVLRFGSRHWTDFAVAYAGVLKAGAIAVPVAAHLPGMEVARIIAHCRAAAVVSPDGPAAIPPGRSACRLTASVRDLEADQDSAGVPRPDPCPPMVEIDYRSGPLSRPQATAYSGDAILSEVAARNGDAETGESLLHSFGVGTDAGRQALWLSLQPGHGPVISLPTFDADRFCELTERRKVARWCLAPCLALLLVESGALERHDLSSMVRVILVGGRVPPWLPDRLGERLPHVCVSAPDTAAASVRPQAWGSETEDEGSLVAPVAFSQEGMLWHEVFAPGSQNLPPLVRRYQGPLDVAALERALSEIARRHQPLRTTFELRGQHPVQVIAPHRPLQLGVRDLSGLARADQEAELDSVLADAGRPFDLVVGPLFRARLLRLGADDHVLVLRVHHSVYDDWSVGVFRRELSALYTAFSAGDPSPLAELPVGFADYSRAHRQRLEGPAGADELAWWMQALAGAPLCLQLPIHDPDRPLGSAQTSPEPVSVELPPELSAQLRALARQQRTTLFLAMLAAFQVLVHRTTGQTELLLASVVANRNRSELEGMIGCFTKKVLVRLAAGGDPTFAELLPRTRASLLGALAHQDLAFETVLQQALGAPAASHGVVPYPVVMFQGVTPQTEEVALPGLSARGYRTSDTTARAHFSSGGGNRDEGPGASTPWGAGIYTGTFLILSVVEAADTISLAARGAFHRPRVEGLLASFATLLADIVAHPDVAVSELDIGDAHARVDGGGELDLRGFRLDRPRLEAALRRCRGVREVRLAVSDERPDPRLVAHVVADGGKAATLAELQLSVWNELPGHAWPAAMVAESDQTPDNDGSADGAAPVGVPEASCLASLWAEVLGEEKVDVGANYWQFFSFLEVMAKARATGLPVANQQVTRNRTIATLAADLATQRHRT